MEFVIHRVCVILSIVFLIFSDPTFAVDKIRSIPNTPAPISDIILSQPFSLDNGFMYDWGKNHFQVHSGTLLVLKVDPSLVYPRNVAEPILYVGSNTAQRLNQGYKSGIVIALVPAEVDLSKEPVWFGSPGLPERVTAATIQKERRMAEKSKIQPIATVKANAIMHEKLHAIDLATLLREHVAELVLKYSPQEKKLVETWRLPVARKAYKQKGVNTNNIREVK